MQIEPTFQSVGASRLMRCNWAARLALLGLCVGALLLTAGCAKREDRFFVYEVGGQKAIFRAKSSAIDKKVSLADFSATVRDVSQSLDGAREAGRFEGTKYCIAQYGTSKIKWNVGPDTAAEYLRVVDDTLTFSGRCDP